MYDPLLSMVIKNKLHKGDVFIDIGANSGFLSLLASTVVGRSGRVYSFEPTKRIFGKLVKNIKLNGFDNIIPYNLALGNENKTSVFYDMGKYDGSNSFVRYDNGSPEITIIRKLDDVLPNGITPNFVKIDVEGFEKEVLLGAKRTILENDRVILVYEYNRSILRKKREKYNEVIDLLHEYGFKLRAMNDKLMDIESREVKSYHDLNPWGCNVYAFK